MKLKSPHFDKLKSLTKKQKKLILAGIALLLLILAACYTVFIAPLLQKEQWIYKEETVERGTLKVGVTESGSLEYNTKSIDYDLNLDVSDDDEDDRDMSCIWLSQDELIEHVNAIGCTLDLPPFSLSSSQAQTLVSFPRSLDSSDRSWLRCRSPTRLSKKNTRSIAWTWVDLLSPSHPQTSCFGTRTPKSTA